MTALHSIAKCLARDCPFEADGPKADSQASKHSDAKGPAHPTVTRTHPTTHCDREGCNDAR